MRKPSVSSSPPLSWGDDPSASPAAPSEEPSPPHCMLKRHQSSTPGGGVDIILPSSSQSTSWTYRSLHSLRGKDLSTIYLRKCEAAAIRSSKRIVHRLERIDRHTTNIFDLSGIGPAASVPSFEVALECVALAHAIREVSIKATGATQHDVEALVHHVSMNPTVTSVDVSMNHLLDQHAATALCDLAQHKMTLQRVVYDGCGFAGSKSAAHLERLLEANKKKCQPMYPPAVVTPPAADSSVSPSSGAYDRVESLGIQQQRRAAYPQLPQSTSPLTSPATALFRQQSSNARHATFGAPSHHRHQATPPFAASSTSSTPVLPPIVLTRCSSSGTGSSTSLQHRSKPDQGGSSSRTATMLSLRTVAAQVQNELSTSVAGSEGNDHLALPLQFDRCILAPLRLALRWLTWQHTTESMAVLSIAIVVVWLPITTSLLVILLLIWFGKRPRDALMSATKDAAADGQYYMKNASSVVLSRPGGHHHHHVDPPAPPPQHVSLRNAFHEFMSPFQTAMYQQQQKQELSLSSPMRDATDDGPCHRRPLAALLVRLDGVRWRLHEASTSSTTSSGVVGGYDDGGGRLDEAIHLLLNPFEDSVSPIVDDVILRQKQNIGIGMRSAEADDKLVRQSAALCVRVQWLLVVAISVAFVTSVCGLLIVSSLASLASSLSSPSQTAAIAPLVVQLSSTIFLVGLFSLDVWWHTLVVYCVGLVLGEAPSSTTTSAQGITGTVAGVVTSVFAARASPGPSSPTPARASSNRLQLLHQQPQQLSGGRGRQQKQPPSSRSSSNGGNERTPSSALPRDEFLETVRASTRPQPLDERYVLPPNTPPPPPSLGTVGADDSGQFLLARPSHHHHHISSLNSSIHSPFSRSSQQNGAASSPMIPQGRLLLEAPTKVGSMTTSSSAKSDASLHNGDHRWLSTAMTASTVSCCIQSIEFQMRKRSSTAAAATVSSLRGRIPSSSSLPHLRSGGSQHHHQSPLMSPHRVESTMHTLRLRLLLWDTVPFYFTVCLRCDTDPPTSGQKLSGSVCLLWHKADADAGVPLSSHASALLQQKDVVAENGGAVLLRVSGLLLDSSATDLGGNESAAIDEIALRLASGSALTRSSKTLLWGYDDDGGATTTTDQTTTTSVLLEVPLTVQRQPSRTTRAGAADDDAIALSMERHQPLMDLLASMDVSICLEVTRERPSSLSPPSLTKRASSSLHRSKNAREPIIVELPTRPPSAVDVAGVQYWELEDEGALHQRRQHPQDVVVLANSSSAAASMATTSSSYDGFSILYQGHGQLKTPPPLRPQKK
ncbi:transmembrane protein, putative [Bodo saltans]|uniref:Transmembrane protein, putative n=1 Tax=Bodo saltans TaxID=75058 RepID=A0A0S4JIS9_BODSA|nr:transmembrane protein, putative [Bodo saltans]|eukprot:CUG89979.1 transmembrane protein, putative [Bodo saltans]